MRTQVTLRGTYNENNLMGSCLLSTDEIFVRIDGLPRDTMWNLYVYGHYEDNNIQDIGKECVAILYYFLLFS